MKATAMFWKSKNKNVQAQTPTQATGGEIWGKAFAPLTVRPSWVIKSDLGSHLYCIYTATHNPQHVPDTARFITKRSTVVHEGLETAAVCPSQ